METTINISELPWYERALLLTDKDKEAIKRAKSCFSYEIDINWAESEIGRQELQNLINTKYHREEYKSGML